MTYLTENAMELMEQLFELKLQSKNMLIEQIPQNPLHKPMLNSGMIVMMIMDMCNKIIIHHSCNVQ